MRIATAYQHSSSPGNYNLPCTNANIEALIQRALNELQCPAQDVVNIQVDGSGGAGEWGVRVFCRKI